MVTDTEEALGLLLQKSWLFQQLDEADRVAQAADDEAQRKLAQAQRARRAADRRLAKAKDAWAACYRFRIEHPEVR